ncbi:MAG: stage II sporulation protein D [Bacilli bacterium]|nr:stage II sporulation protein D [Bacilli bacterium]
MIKKILLFSFLIVFIPFIIVTIFIRDDEITFNFSSNSVVRVYREDTGVIDEVPIEEYVVGVVSGEMPIEFELEALKAQAVAARSYVMIQLERNINKEYDVVDSVTNQVYLDKSNLMTAWKESYTDNINKVKMAVLSTKGEYISYNGKVAEALFFSTSPGKTENSEDIFTNQVAYLRSVDSHWDEISPVYISNTTFTLTEFCNLLGLDYSDTLTIEVIESTSTGRIKRIKINNKEFTGNYICSKLSLRSTYFEIIVEGTKVVIKNKGYGHGVGMSQYGAEGMAKEGYTYQDILKHYYTGVEIKKF